MKISNAKQRIIGLILIYGILFLQVFSRLLHIFVLRPIRWVIALVSVFKVLSWTGIDFFVQFVKKIDTDVLAPFVGFEGGFTPISSPKNFLLYCLMLVVGSMPTILILIRAVQEDRSERNLWIRLEHRLHIGNSLSKIGNTAKFLIFFAIIGVANGILPNPFPSYLKYIILCLLAVTFFIDYYSYTQDGERYGMPAVFGRSAAIKKLASDLDISENDLKQRLENDKQLLKVL